MNIKFQLHNHGFEVREQVCPPDLLARLQAEFSPDTTEDNDLLEHSELVRQEAVSGFFATLAAEVLGAGCFATHAVFYNKPESAEPWHQETQVKTGERGFALPEDKSIYRSLLTVRLSLDDCSFFDGALKLCPSSHKHGVLTAQEIRGHSLRPFSSPEMKARDVVLMHPLTIHATAASTTGKPRRVVHLVFAAAQHRDYLAGA